MTKNEFAALCLAHTIDPYIALENDNVVAILKQGVDTNDHAKRDNLQALIDVFNNEF